MEKLSKFYQNKKTNILIINLFIRIILMLKTNQLKVHIQKSFAQIHVINFYNNMSNLTVTLSLFIRKLHLLKFKEIKIWKKNNA